MINLTLSCYTNIDDIIVFDADDSESSPNKFRTPQKNKKEEEEKRQKRKRKKRKGHLIIIS